MNRIKKWILPGLVFLLPGCVSYSTFELDVLKPAEVAIPVEIASVVVVDNAYPLKAEEEILHKINLPSAKYEIDSITVDDFGNRVIQSFGESLKTKAFFDSVYVVSQPFNTSSDGSPLAPLSSQIVDSLCNLYNAQAVIELGSYKYNTNITIINISDQYYATLDASAATYWKIHDFLSGEVLNAHLQKDTIFWDSVGASISNSVEGLPLIRNAVEEAARYSGMQYSDYVAPGWQNATRYFFKQGHPLFYDAISSVNNGDWEEAARIWYYVYEQGRDKQKARAAYNLALAQEVKGDFMEATSWAYRSMEHFKEVGGLNIGNSEEKMAKSYYIELAKRLQEKKRLDKQFGIDD